MLSIQSFRAATDKVCKAEFHPTQPWVVAATKSDAVSIWDWTSQQVLLKLQLGEVGESEMFGDADLGRLHLKDDAVMVNPSLNGPSTSRSATGKVRDVRFLDADTAAAQLNANHALAYGSTLPAPSPAPLASSLRGQRLLVLVCESKVLLWDLVSRTAREITSKAALDGKSPICCAFLFLTGAQTSNGAPQVLSSPVLALGCSDGQIRLFTISSLLPMGVLTSQHKSAVVCMTVTHAKGAAHEVLVAGFAGGSMASWEPMAKQLSVGRHVAIAPTGDHKSHDKEVVGLVNVCIDEAPLTSVGPTAPGAGPAAGGRRSMLMSAGMDARCLGFECSTLRELVKHKLDSKAPPSCLAYVPRGFTASNTHCLLMGTDIGVVLALHPTIGSLRVVCTLSAQIPAGAKKLPKVYHIGVHPLQPHLILLACNTGVALATLDLQLTPPAVPLPLLSPGQVLDNGGDGISFVVAVGDSVYCSIATTNLEKAHATAAETAAATKQAAAAMAAADKAAAADKEAKAAKDKPKQGADLLLELLDEPATPAPPPLDRKPPMPGSTASPGSTPGPPQDHSKAATIVHVVGTWRLATGRPASRAILAVSYDGSYVSACWPASKHYSIYSRTGPAQSWEEVSAGAGVSVAWHACANQFAVVELASPSAQAPAPTASSKGKGGGIFKGGAKPTAKEQEKQRMEAAAAAAATAAATSTPPQVHVKSCDGRRVTLSHHALPMSPQDTPESLSGGPLLGVTLTRQLTNATLYPGDEPPPALQLYDWGRGTRVGVEVAAPLVLAWDPSLTLVALAYTSQVLICTAQPAMHMVATLPIANATGIHWGMRQLYIATPTAIYLAFVSLPPAQDPHPAPVFVRMLTLASLAAPAPGVPSAFTGTDLSLLGAVPMPVPRPAGPLALLGARDGFLWVLDVHGQPQALPLARHPGVRVMCVAAAGDSMGAVQLANSSLPPTHHAAVAAFVCGLHGNRGAQSALLLTGLRLVDEARLRLALHHWVQASEAVEALLAGFVHRPPVGSFPYALTNAAFNEETTGGFNGLVSLEVGGVAQSLPNSLRAYPDDLDWSAPIRAAATNQSTTTALAIAAGVPPAALASVSPEGLALGLQLLSGLRASGTQDVCRYVAQMLLPQAQAMQPPQLSELLVVMAELGMKQELSQLVLGLGSVGGATESLGMLAALLSGHTAQVADVLGGGPGSGGSAALAAALAAAGSKDPTSSMVALQAWHDELRAVASGHAAPGVASGAVPYFQPQPVEA